MTNFRNAHFTNATYQSIVNNNGFVSLANSGASKYVVAIKNDFLTNSSEFNLSFQNAFLCTGKTTKTTFQGR